MDRPDDLNFDPTPDEDEHKAALTAEPDPRRNSSADNSFRDIADFAPVLLWVTEREGACTFLSKSWYEFTGQSEEEGLGYGWQDAVHPDDRKRAADEFRLATREQRLYSMDYRLRTAAGDYRWVLDTGRPRLDESGEFAGFVGSVVDVHERKLAEIEIAGTEEIRAHFAAIAESSADAIYSYDLEGRIRYWNPSAARMFGYAQHEVIGRDAREFVEPERVKEIDSIIEAVRRGGHIADLETRRVRRDGEFFNVSITASPVFDRERKPVAVSVIARDITHRLEAEEALSKAAESLGRERERLAVALRAAKMGVYEWEVGESGVWWSPEVYPLYGVDPASFAPTVESFTELIHPDDREELWKGTEESLATGEPFMLEYRVIWPDGTLRWIANRSHVSTGDDGRPARLTGVAVDITDRRRSDEALRRSEEMFRLATDAGSMGIWEWDIIANRVTWSESLYLIHGIEKEDFDGTVEAFASLVHEEDREAVTNAIRRTLEDGEPYDVEFRALRPDGEVIWIHTSARVIRDRDGSPLRLIGTTVDITARKRAELALRRSEERFRLLVQNSAHVIWQTDGSGRFLGRQESWERFTGQRYEDYVDLGGFNAVHPDDRERLMAAWTEGLARPAAFEAEYRLRHRSGEYRHVLSRGIPVKGADGSVAEVIGYIEDITDRKRGEQALREREARFRILSEAIPVMVWAAQPDGSLIHVNQRWKEYTGQRDGEFAGFGWTETLHPDDRPGLLEHWLECTRTGSAYEGECRYRRHDGVYRWHYFRGLPLMGEDGRISSWYGASVDIDDRKSAERDLDVRARQQRTVADLGLAALRQHDLGALFDEAVRSVAETLDVELCKVLQVMPGGNEVLLTAGVGWHKGLVGTGRVGAGMDSQAGYTLRSHGPVIVDDLRTETRFSGPPLLHEHGVVSGISCVIMGDGAPWGVLGAHTRARRIFTEDDISFLQAVANVLATSIQRTVAEEAVRDARDRLEEKVAERTRELRELAALLSDEVRERAGAETQVKEILARMIDIQEEERRRIGRNIHDDLGQHITALRMGIATLANADGHYTERLDLVTRIAAELDQAIDNVTWELRPGHIEQFGLSRSLANLADGWSRRFGIPCEYQAEMADTGVRADVQLQIYRIAQEALHNVFKHSGATRAGVILEHREGEIRLVVEDNGVGFDGEDAAEGDRGLGLESMRERAVLVGGTLQIESSPGEGTTVIVSVPAGDGLAG